MNDTTAWSSLTRFERSLVIGYRSFTPKDFLVGYKFALLDSDRILTTDYDDVEFLFNFELIKEVMQ